MQKGLGKCRAQQQTGRVLLCEPTWRVKRGAVNRLVLGIPTVIMLVVGVTNLLTKSP